MLNRKGFMAALGLALASSELGLFDDTRQELPDEYKVKDPYTPRRKSKGEKHRNKHYRR